MQFSRPLIVIAGMLLSSSVGFAQATTEVKPTTRVGMQLRVDADSQTKKPEGGEEEKSFGLKLSTARILVAGEVNPQLSYTLRLNVRSAGGFSSSAQDGGMNALDRAYLELKPKEFLLVRIGRVPLMTGSLEIDYSSIDQYMYSYLAETLYSQISPTNVTFEVGGMFVGQGVAVQVTNGLPENNNAGKKTGVQDSGDLSYAVGYRGRFVDGMIKPILSYTVVNRIPNKAGTDKDEDVAYVSTGIGVQFSVIGIDLDVETDSLKRDKFKAFTVDTTTGASTGEVENPEQEATASIVQLAYNYNDFNLRPFAKFTQDVHEVDGKDFFESARSALGIEWKPVKGFRYHLAYVTKDDDTFKADVKSNTKTTQVLLGAAGRL